MKLTLFSTEIDLSPDVENIDLPFNSSFLSHPSFLSEDKKESLNER